MPRQPRPWYRANRHMWFTTLAGKQIPLYVSDPADQAAAVAALHRLLQGQAPPPPSKTVAEVVAAFLADAAARLKPTTMKAYRWYANRFAADFPGRLADTITADDLERAGRRSDWSKSSRHNYLATCENVLRWAGVKPGRKVRKPAKESAGAAAVIPETVYRQALQHFVGNWHAAVVFLWNTGARPSEAAAVTAENTDWDARVVRLREHKTAASGHDRLIYLNDAAYEVLTWQRQRYPAGLLFRSQRGGRLTSQAFAKKFIYVSHKIGRRITAYGLRHSYCTRALAGGESDTVVASLVGHSSTEMVHKHYSHVSEMGRQLREAAGRIG